MKKDINHWFIFKFEKDLCFYFQLMSLISPGAVVAQNYK